MHALLTSHRMVMCLPSSMFAAAGIQVANSSRLQTNRAMDTTLLSGWRTSRSATVKSRCGADLTQASTNGRPRKNFRRIWQRSYPLPLRTQAWIIHRITTSRWPTTCNGSRLRAVTPHRTISSAIKNSGAQNSWTLTRSISLSNRSIHSWEIHRLISSAYSSTQRPTHTTMRCCRPVTSSKSSHCQF